MKNWVSLFRLETRGLNVHARLDVQAVEGKGHDSGWSTLKKALETLGLRWVGDEHALNKSPRMLMEEVLHDMPDEAFGWFALACIQGAMTHGALTQIWPDGIGGFTAASRTTIEAIRAAAQAYAARKQPNANAVDPAVRESTP